MESFRYSQFCPIARAAEVLGHRWVLPLLRELFIGPQRFSDLRRRMGGAVSTSVLSKRLVALERQGVVARRVLPPPAASVVYELTPRGRALEPALLGLIRWGALMMTSPLSGEHFEPEWLRLAARAFARSETTPELSFELHATGQGPDAIVRGHGGASGTHIDSPDDSVAELCVRGPAVVLLGYLAGEVSPESLTKHPDVVIEGVTQRVAELPVLFDVPSENSGA